ncbi:hypothetical protein BJ166DRAFT_544547 [Pestalotiopsis sp. NC0098]|nr:hypothetical protein BJ166DRAFT_544547 [Pestalotiopsis sp. NC0098]
MHCNVGRVACLASLVAVSCAVNVIISRCTAYAGTPPGGRPEPCECSVGRNEARKDGKRLESSQIAVGAGSISANQGRYIPTRT